MFIAPIIVFMTPLIKELTVFTDDFIVPKNPSIIFSAPFHALSQFTVNIPATKSIKPVFRKFVIVDIPNKPFVRIKFTRDISFSHGTKVDDGFRRLGHLPA